MSTKRLPQGLYKGLRMVQLSRMSKSLFQEMGKNRFLWIIISVFLFQSLWIAFSFRYPMSFDENFHIPVIDIFSHQLSPVIVDQPTSYDHLGNLEHGSVSVYHYLMSFPDRLIGVFTDSFPVKVVFLRIINILMVALGLWIYSKLFRKMGVKNAHINIGLMIFILLPIVPFVAAHVNYDNMLFPLTGFYFLLGINIIRSKRPEWHNMALLLSVGILACLIKFTFFPIFVISLIFLSYLLYARFGNRVYRMLKESFLVTKRWIQVISVSVFILFGSFFTYVYGQNIIMYGKLNPSCAESLGSERCAKNFVAQRATLAHASKSQRPLLPIPDFTFSWLKNMLIGTASTSATPVRGSGEVRWLKTFYTLLFFGFLASIFVILYSWRGLFDTSEWFFLGTVILALVVSVFAVNLKGHLTNHTLYAQQPRYLLSNAPVLIVMSVISFNKILATHRRIKFLSLTILLLLFTQGGGLITHITLSKGTWYWQRPLIINVNEKARAILRPFVIGS